MMLQQGFAQPSKDHGNILISHGSQERSFIHPTTSRHLIWVLSLSFVSAISLDRQLFCSCPSHHLMGIYWPTPRTKPGQAMQNRHTLTNHHISCSTSLAPAPKFPNLLHGPQSNHCPVRGYLGQVGDLSVVHSHGAKVLQKQLTAKAGTPACELL